MSQPALSPINSVLKLLDEHGITTSQFVLTLLTKDFSGQTASRDLLNHINEIFSAFILYDDTSRQTALQCAFNTATNTLQEEMCLLTRKETGVHFLARKTTESKLLEFNIPEMAMKMKDLAPHLWELLNILLEANPRLTNKHNWARKKAESLGKARHRTKKNTMADGEMELV